ncbi:MAG: hypothetical protein N2645_03565 [Clostridia bacterium]|nr:hypothetical protein [Clostridia bacterium]
MFQRPHQLLKEFGRQGWLSVLYNLRASSSSMDLSSENFYIYNKTCPSPQKQDKRVLWIPYPPLYSEIGKFNEDLVIYDCIDYPGEEFSHWQKGLQVLRERADVIFVTSETLYQFNKNYRSKTFICKNGADFSHFSKAIHPDLKPPQDIKNIKRPIIGYMGAVAKWIDWRLIDALSKKKQFSLVFIGPLFGLSEPPVKASNIFYLGKKEYGELPNYLRFFDVCIIPFQKSNLTKACNPVKMYEYLSAGKSVVATDLDECRIDVVKVCSTHEGFYNGIMSSLKSTPKETIDKRIAFARENSWEQRVKLIRSVIEPKLQ